MWYCECTKLGARAGSNYDKWLLRQRCSKSTVDEVNVLIVDDLKLVRKALMHDADKISDTHMWTWCLLEWNGGPQQMTGTLGECLPGARPACYFSMNYPDFSPRFTLPWRSPPSRPHCTAPLPYKARCKIKQDL